MDRRDFLKAAAALPAIAVVPAVAAEPELGSWKVVGKAFAIPSGPGIARFAQLVEVDFKPTFREWLAIRESMSRAMQAHADRLGGIVVNEVWESCGHGFHMVHYGMRDAHAVPVEQSPWNTPSQARRQVHEG